MQEELQQRFEYRDGNLYYKVQVKGHKVGDLAGFLSQESGLLRRHITYKGKRMIYARLVWIYHHGDIPEDKTIDHINRIATDDRIENLRLACKRLQAENRTAVNICFDKRRNHWVARIKRDGKRHYLGSASTKEGALELVSRFKETAIC